MHYIKSLLASSLIINLFYFFIALSTYYSCDKKQNQSAITKDVTERSDLKKTETNETANEDTTADISEMHSTSSFIKFDKLSKHRQVTSSSNNVEEEKIISAQFAFDRLARVSSSYGFGFEFEMLDKHPTYQLEFSNTQPFHFQANEISESNNPEISHIIIHFNPSYRPSTFAFFDSCRENALYARGINKQAKLILTYTGPLAHLKIKNKAVIIDFLEQKTGERKLERFENENIKINCTLQLSPPPEASL